jgi:hypothetical protein
MYGTAEESDQEPPARSQKIRTEATSDVPGEATRPRLALQLAPSPSHPSLVERRRWCEAHSPIGLQPHGRRKPKPAAGFFMKKPPMCHKPGLGCAASGMIDLPAFLGISSLDLTSLRRGNFLDQFAPPQAVILHGVPLDAVVSAPDADPDIHDGGGVHAHDLAPAAERDTEHRQGAGLRGVYCGEGPGHGPRTRIVKIGDNARAYLDRPNLTT